MLHKPGESLTSTLPPEMAPFIDPDKVSANARGYPEFDWQPDRHEQRALELVRTNFLNIDLSHATASDPDALQRDGILPFSDLAQRDDWRPNTGSLDESLGLHRYAFLHWGAFHPTQNGRYILAVDVRDTLLSPDTIATPHDINATMFSYMDTDASSLPPEGQERLGVYLDQIVSGSDWVDIVSRRALKHMVRSRDPSIYAIRNHTDLGEVKHFGPVAPSSISSEVVDIYDDTTMHPRWRSMIDNSGVAVSYVTNSLHAQEHGAPTSDKDKLPHEVGADIEKSRRLWREILDVAQKG